MDQQIVDPSLNYNAAISTDDPRFEMEKYIYMHRSRPDRS